MAQPTLLREDRGILFQGDTVALCNTLDMQSDVISEAHDSPLGGGHQRAQKMAATIASRFDWPHFGQTVQAWV